MTKNNIRFQQRFENFSQALFLLEEALQQKSWNKLEKEGIIQRFEYSFELAWKTIKDYLYCNEVVTEFPRDTIKKAFLHHIIDDGEVWIDMLQKRNIMSHTYNEENFENVFLEIQTQYFLALKKLHLYFTNKLNEN